jgi:hypothetical protein
MQCSADQRTRRKLLALRSPQLLLKLAFASLPFIGNQSNHSSQGAMIQLLAWAGPCWMLDTGCNIPCT